MAKVETRVLLKGSAIVLTGLISFKFCCLLDRG